MKSLREKLRTLGLGTVHDVLDRATDLNSPAAIKQDLRDLSAAKDKLREARVAQTGRITNLERAIDSSTAQEQKISSEIDFLLSDNDKSNDESTYEMQESLDKLAESRTGLEFELAATKAAEADLLTAVEQVGTKFDSLNSQLSSITARAAQTKAKNAAATAIQNASSTVTSVGGMDIDSVAARVQLDGDVADARFQDALGSLTSKSDKDVARARAIAAIRERQARLTAGAVAQTVQDSPSASVS